MHVLMCGSIAAAIVLSAAQLMPTSASNSAVYTGFNFYGSGNKCYLKDMDNNTIHTWTGTSTIISHAYLLRDSSVLFACYDNKDYGSGSWGERSGGGVGMPGGMIALPSGRFQIIKWDGTVAWDFPYHGTNFMPHHDCYPHYFTTDLKELPHVFAIVATLEADNTIAEKIVEFKPTGKTTADTVWEWKAWDHMTENGADKPELLDINKGGCNAMGFGGDSGCGGGKGKEWLHANHVRYNPSLDQVLVDLRYFGEFILLDHSTTTAQAATHSGGKYGKGGDILYRWGNSSSYGVAGTQFFHQQHGVCFIPNYMPGTRKPLPGAGHILVISNKDKKGYEVVLPSTNGVYTRSAGKAFDPASPLWSITISSMGGNEGSIQRLPNGNTLACNGIDKSGVSEYDSSGKSLWTMKITSGECHRIDSAYLGSTILDTANGSSEIGDGPAFLKKNSAPMIEVQTDRGMIRITFGNEFRRNITAAVYSADGRNVLQKTVSVNKFTWQRGDIPAGIYFIKAAAGTYVTHKRFAVLR